MCMVNARFDILQSIKQNCLKSAEFQEYSVNFKNTADVDQCHKFELEDGFDEEGLEGGEDVDYEDEDGDEDDDGEVDGDSEEYGDEDEDCGEDGDGDEDDYGDEDEGVARLNQLIHEYVSGNNKAIKKKKEDEGDDYDDGDYGDSGSDDCDYSDYDD